MTMCRRAPFLTLLTTLLALVAASARPAAAQVPCTDPSRVCDAAANSTWLGDINDDGRVNQEDISIWISCIGENFGSNGQVVYCPEGDLNFDGEIDQDDLNYLNQLVAMASDASVGKLPRSQLSELRIRKPFSQTDPLISQSRYVEIRTPTTAANNFTGAPTVNQAQGGDPETIKRFGAGWYYIKVARSTDAAGLDTVSGTVAVVVSLDGMAWVTDPLDATSRGLSVVADESFYDPPPTEVSPLLAVVPPAVQGFIYEMPAGDSLAIPVVPTTPPNSRIFPAENATNVSHLLVFRRPSASNPRAVPQVGQRINTPSNVNPNEVCDIAWTVAGATPAGSLPPWDAVVDCVTIVRSTNTNSFGCIYGDTGTTAIGPVGTSDNNYAPPHIYRCRTALTLTKGADAITATSDTPFRRNPSCVSTAGGCGENATDGSARDCFEVQTGPYCSDADCCSAVCAIDPTCCSNVWDAGCVDRASITCVTCGNSTASCYVAHATPSCSDADCCTRVCALDPLCCQTAWDAGCASLAIDNCLACGASAGACDEIHSLPYCNDSECCDRVCQTDPSCCAITWDLSCVQTARSVCASCGDINAGPCCIAHGSPYCNDGTCCVAVCALDPFCCASGWDISCTQVAQVTPACVNQNCVCGGQTPPGGEVSCFVVHTAGGCTDSFCCQTVCIRDPYCCYVTWDQSCVNVANDLCSTQAGCIDPVTSLPVNGSCFVAHAGKGCDKPGCCSIVCADPSFVDCCNVEWDGACALRASEVCDACGDPLAGSCFQAHPTPNCADGACCNSVCNVDPFCCEGVWDGLCVEDANVLCPSPISACGVAERSCWIPNYQPGCGDSTCCVSICRDIDPFCCEARWDAVCAREATYICTPDFVVTIGREGCLNAHASSGCANVDCSRAVCSVDPSCCTNGWDQGCVSVATAVCPAPEACPGVGDCFLTHSSPGCKDSSCCNGVCNADPVCCQAEWDATCATVARALCKVPAGTDWNCPCNGSCFENHQNGGCSDGACCSIVCNLSPSCCEASWDSDCVSLARGYCCGSPGCGSGCNQSCLVPHTEPYCSDPYCCDAICRGDPLCCSATWDALCAAAAVERCGSACGLQDSGDCFVEHDLPGCRDGNCCAAVCAIDSSCCTITWDETCVDITARPALALKCIKPQCGDDDAGDPCTPHDNAASNNAACCTQVCGQDTYCCDAQWDSSCVDIARTLTVCGCSFECGDPCAGDCCRAHDNGACDDPACCSLICASDSYCCDTLWDSVCASTARETCIGKNDACPVPPCGSDMLPNCCIVSPLPNCSDQGCCTRICASDPFCCQSSWDNACVAAAAEDPGCNCDGPACGDAGTGGCFQVHATPFCNEAGCCESVCAFTPECCTVSWDADCVAVAQFLCGGAFNGLLDAYRGGPIGAGRGRMQPPAGWIPPRQRATMREPKELPPSVALPKRPASPATEIPRSEGIEIKPGKGSTATQVPVGGKSSAAPTSGKASGATGGK